MIQEIRSVGICRGSKRWDTLSLGNQFSDVLKASITFMFNDGQFLMFLRLLSPSCSTVISF